MNGSGSSSSGGSGGSWSPGALMGWPLSSRSGPCTVPPPPEISQGGRGGGADGGVRGGAGGAFGFPAGQSDGFGGVDERGEVVPGGVGAARRPVQPRVAFPGGAV